MERKGGTLITRRLLKENLRKYGIYCEEFSNGTLVLTKTTESGWTEFELSLGRPDDLFPEVTISDGQISISFHNVLVRNRADSRELSRNLELIWDFLDDEEVKKILDE